MMIEEEERREEKKVQKPKEVPTKRGRKPKKESEGYKLNREQVKFFIDLSKEEKELRLIQDLLVKANNKEHGKEITVKELAVYGMKRLNQKDLEQIQEDSLTKMEKVHRAMMEYNKKNNCSLELGEFLVKKLNIN